MTNQLARSEPDHVDTRDMLVIHTSLRREYRLAPALVRAVAPGDMTLGRRVSEHLDFFKTMLHRHRGGEDSVPFILARRAFARYDRRVHGTATP
jgi:hypothetical protein